MTAADQPKRHRTVEGGRSRQRRDGPAGGIGQQRMHESFIGDRSGADKAVFRLEEHVHALRHVFRH
jgi:hypothetical protein